ncbi:MAG: hypothetical protein RL711_428 [Bacteroidota bacterium]
MSRFYSYLNSAAYLLDHYKGELPFAIFLKQYFAKEKKYGSKDRKFIGALCYHYFRTCKAIQHSNKETQLLMATFICENQPNALLAFLKPDWNSQIEADVAVKIALLQQEFQVDNIFPLAQHISAAIDVQAFCKAMLVQPALFLRLRPSKHDKVLEALTAAAIPFAKLAPNTVALANGSKMPDTLTLHGDYVVQDYGSQQVGDFIAPYLSRLSPQANIWDCCAASGGKSIMLADLGFTQHLYVSDIRASMLANLSQRFAEAGITNYTSFLADLTSTDIKSPLPYYELILADVPCSGSGTWGRTPEQISYFEEENLLAFSQRQKKIVQNISQFLKPGGLLVYITCSVFVEENEEVVNTLIDSDFIQLASHYIAGYQHKADSMYLSILQKK